MHSTEEMDVDLLIVGGGIQGLTLLAQCLSVGWKSCLLISRDPLGTGETLHSHGYDLKGYMIAAEGSKFVETFTRASSFWQSFSEQHGVKYLDQPPTYFGVPEQNAADRVNFWQKVGLPFSECAELPAPLRGGSYEGGSRKLFKTENRLLPPWRLVEKLAEPLQNNIAQGELVEIQWDAAANRVTRCSFKVGGVERKVAPKLLLLAAGRENQALMRGIRDLDGGTPFSEKLAELHAVRYVPMVLIKGALPDLSGTFTDLPLLVVSHPTGDGQAMWIVTPMDQQRTVRDDFARDEDSPIDTALMQQVFQKLCALIPSVRSLLGQLSFSAYLGPKIDHPEGKPTWFRGDLGVKNLRFVWPVFWTMAGVASESLVEELRGTPVAKDFTETAAFSGAQHGVRMRAPLGEEKRLSAAQQWESWPAFKERYKISI
jgi:hypothetical protein